MSDVSLFFKKRIILIVILVVFIVFKIPHLSLPWYWDESWPYAAAIRSLHDGGIGLLPQNLQPDFSRGHPLLFHAAAATWMKVFGGSYVAMHSFSLCIALLLLIVVYENVLFLFGNGAAIASTALIAVTEGFIVQSSAVILEVPFALLTLLVLFSYVRGRSVATFIFLAALLLVKESGLVLWAWLSVYSFLSVCFRPDGRSYWPLFWAVSVAAIPLGLFFLLQKQVYGWYLFPLHAGTLRTNWQDYWNMFRTYVLSGVFCKNLRYVYFILMSLLAIAVAYKKRNWRYLIVLAPVLYVYQLVDDARCTAILPPVYFFALLYPVWLGSSVYIGNKLVAGRATGQFVLLSSVFMLLFITFSTFTFLIYRYLIVLVLLAIILFVALSAHFLRFLPRYATVLTVLVTGTTAIAGFRESQTDKGDADFGAYDGVVIHQQVASYMQYHRLQNAHVATGAYLQLIHLTQPLTGFVLQNQPFVHVKWEIDDSTQYIIFDNVEPDYRYNRRSEWSNFHQVARFQKGVLWAEVYQRNDTIMQQGQ